MRAWILAPYFLMAAPIAAQAVSVVHTNTLKAWIDQGKEMTILDARGNYDPKMIPGAKWVPYDAPEDEIGAAAPIKTRTVVIYCWSESCPASAHLADRMVSLGYTHVYEYPEGLQDWIQKGYPVTGM